MFKFLAARTLLLGGALVLLITSADAQGGGTLRGRVTFENGERIVDNATVTIVQFNRTATTDENGNYVFENVPAGTYDVAVRLIRFPERIERVTINGATSLDLQLQFATVRENVTVTASSTAETIEEAIRPTSVIGSIALTERAHTSIGEALEYEPGVAKRSFGPGTSRPVIRGFDGDRVLILSDNLSVGSLGSQSGDHGEPVNVVDLERVEIVRGPGTLLYGSNAIGGVVNAISNNDTKPNDPRGFMTVYGGTTNRQAGGAAGFETLLGKNFTLFASGGGNRTGDYLTPIGRVGNSKSRSFNGTAGLGYYAGRGYFKVSANYDQRLYGVPFAGLFEAGGGVGASAVGIIPEQDETIDVQMRRQNFRFNSALRDLTNRFFQGAQAYIEYSDYQHKELEGAEVGTVFNNDQFAYRGVIEQRRHGKFSGRFGVQGLTRDYETIGAEALAPPVKHHNLAAFALEEIGFERLVLQFGGRVESNRYRPASSIDGEAREGIRNRNFTGVSGAVGARYRLFDGANLVFNYQHSYRAPSLEELYNFGAHIGTLTFEVGRADLQRERANTFDGGFRYGARRVQLSANAFYYDIKDYVFLAPTGETEDNLPVGLYSQADARYYGTEIGANFAVIPNRLNLDGSFDYVDARIKDGLPLPRIPPARGRIGVEFLAGGFRLQPEAIFASSQEDLFVNETRTAGYTIYNLRGSYTIPQEHFAHVLTVNAFNLSDKLYRNHVSFIKDLAPEIGRGVRIAYTLRFF